MNYLPARRLSESSTAQRQLCPYGPPPLASKQLPPSAQRLGGDVLVPSRGAVKSPLPWLSAAGQAPLDNPQPGPLPTCVCSMPIHTPRRRQS